MTEEFLSYEQAAARLGVSTETVEGWALRGVIPTHKVPNGRKVFVLSSELAATIAAW